MANPVLPMFARFVVVLAATIAQAGVWAQAQGFPIRPVKLVLGFSAGGSGDQLARILALDFQRQTGQPLVIDNRPGAATNIASEAVARAAPDGYTLLLGGNFSHAVNPALFGSKLPFDPLKDFAPVALVNDTGGMVIVVPAALPVNTMSEFVSYAKREGDKVNFASSGLSSPGHIAGGYLNQRAGLRMTHVPYKGSSEATRDLLGGVVQMTITAPTSAMPLVRDGRLKALAVTTAQRSRLAPDVPGAAEAGLKDFDINGWYGIFAPAGTPQAVVDRLNAVFVAALAEPATRQKLEDASLGTAPAMSSQRFGQFVRDELQRWKPIVELSGATIN